MKIKVTHTPGPWKVDESKGYHVRDSNGDFIASAGSSFGSDEDAANARLIATAPELLNRLKIMADSFHHNGQHGGELNKCDSAVCMDNMNTIYKAEGVNA